MTYSYEAILFDCDGVIVDTESLSSQILKQQLREIGLDLDDHTMHTQFAGFTTAENMQLVEQMLGRSVPNGFLEQYRQAFHSSILSHLEPIQGVRQLLSKIDKPIAMATNANRHEMNLKLELIGLTETFSTRFAVDDVEHGKPAPDLYLKAAAALNVAPEHCIVIEDSVAGIRAGVAAGATVLAYSDVISRDAQLAAGASATFNSMKELEALLALK
ncbi:HAD family hydrolase [Marinomonas ostreistagni]|uniref:HAD family hydrolase n=1 Tax=Marinomonas ostreistagni TaxID=359209 RepID=UPI00194EE44F|nr:HAD family phosphatase [Marinomonas ostreistagni]MBM6550338.1 HAD family phosphatase [Marinomonas ostreistagni]